METVFKYEWYFGFNPVSMYNNSSLNTSEHERKKKKKKNQPEVYVPYVTGEKMEIILIFKGGGGQSNPVHRIKPSPLELNLEKPAYCKAVQVCYMPIPNEILPLQTEICLNF